MAITRIKIERERERERGSINGNAWNLQSKLVKDFVCVFHRDEANDFVFKTRGTRSFYYHLIWFALIILM
jgi:hypothetical protein